MPTTLRRSGDFEFGHHHVFVFEVVATARARAYCDMQATRSRAAEQAEYTRWAFPGSLIGFVTVSLIT